MGWKKKGLIFCANGQYEFMNTHTTPINAVVLDNKIRIFFSSRATADKDGNYISYPCYIDVDKNNPQKILKVCDKPILELGKRGMFDEHGIMIAKSIFYNERLYLYYMGWQRLQSKESPYQVMLGLAISDDNGETFCKISEGPIMGRDIYDPLSIGNVFVVKENENWYMYYTSYKRWEYNGVKATPEYNIKLATSNDGINWLKDNTIIIDEDEYGGIATPTIIKRNNQYEMYFGYRKTYSEDKKIGGYRIGYAKSKDLLNWNRNDEEAGITLSADGWDSEMVCYPDVVEVEGKVYMFYCGNGFGKTGFGYAVLEE